MRKLILATIILFSPSAVMANGLFEEAFDFCQEQEARSYSEGPEISPWPISFENGLWMIQWIDGHIEEGRKPFAVRYQGEVFMIIPWPATTNEGVICQAVHVR